MTLRILLPLALVSLLSLTFCKKEPAPIVFTVSNNLSGEPIPGAAIYSYRINIPLTTMTRIGQTDINGQLTWEKVLDTLPDPQTNYFTCESPGFYQERFHFTDIAQKSFDVKMRQHAVVHFNLKYQNSAAPQSFFIYEQYTNGWPNDGAWMIYDGYNKTSLDESFQKPIPDLANIKFHCFKIDSLDLVHTPMPANRLPDNLIADQIFEIHGNPEQPVYSFDVFW